MAKLVNYANIARDCGVDAKTVREYFLILVDTLLRCLRGAVRAPSLALNFSPATPRFYLFDVGLAGYQAGRRIERPAGPEFGRALEHFILMELLGYRSYREENYPIRFWRTKTGLECDFVLGWDGEIAIEVKGTNNVQPRDLNGIRGLRWRNIGRGRLLSSATSRVPGAPPTACGSLPWHVFLERLWFGRGPCSRPPSRAVQG